jgi:phenylalanyl-tRNA synthetase beta chain
MKLSLSWIFDHIDADWQKQDPSHIAARFNQVTAEIEHVATVSWDLKPFFIGTIISSHQAAIQLDVPELGKKIELPFARLDTSYNQATTAFMVKQDGANYRWATLADFDSDKDGLMPAFYATADDLAGGWRKRFQAHDFIFEVDNKSVTHRPDMWGHRGFAREIAAYLDLKLSPAKDFLSDLPISHRPADHAATTSNPITISNKAPQACTRFTGVYIGGIDNRPCDFYITSRLLKIGSRPLGGIVDLTNYLMNDWGQPVHAYDADKLVGQSVTIRMATPGEKMTLLDGTVIDLTDQDAVIADAQTVHCLAGVRGGQHSGVSAATKNIFFEAATFDPGFIRRSAQRHKTRTDSSARFEKTLDANLSPQAAPRFIKLLAEYGIKAQPAHELLSVGKTAEPLTISMTHDFLEKRAGMPFKVDEVVTMLTRLEFGVAVQKDAQGKTEYTIAVPTFRSSKDVKIREDILEEVVRSYGFERIALVAPEFVRAPYSPRAVVRTEQLKRYWAFGCRMTEQQNYALADESFLKQLGYTPDVAVSLVNPISENHPNMITSLVPGLLKNISENHHQRESLAFFELGRVWQNDQGEPVERKSLAGISFKKRTDVDFYGLKDAITIQLTMLGFDAAQLTWQKIEEVLSAPWYKPYQTAAIFYGDKKLGYLGKADQRILTKLAVDTACDAAIFELDANFLTEDAAPVPTYKPISKFQDTYIDISMFVPLALEVANLEKLMTSVSGLITKTELLDVFEKPEWTDKRSMTFRLWLSSHEQTLEKDMVDAVWKNATELLTTHGATVRM